MFATRSKNRDADRARERRRRSPSGWPASRRVHPWRIVAAWGLILAASIVAIGALIGSAFTSDASLDHQPGLDAGPSRCSPTTSPRATAIDDAVVIYSAELTTDDPEFKAFVADVRSSIEGTGATQTVRDPYAADGAGISEDGHAAVVTLVLGARRRDRDRRRAGRGRRRDSDADFEVDITGDNTLDHDFTELSESDLTNGELKFGLPAAMIVLILVFGALVAAFLPMSIAIVSIIVTVAIVLGARPVHLAVLLHRQHDHRDGARARASTTASSCCPATGRSARPVATRSTRSSPPAAPAARRSCSRGSSFVVALLGLLLVPDTILRSLALGAIIVGVVTMAAALTLLPAAAVPARRPGQRAAAPDRRPRPPRREPVLDPGRRRRRPPPATCAGRRRR